MSTSWRKGAKNMHARITVATLKSTWTIAVCFAFAFEFIEARTASIVEPMLLPMTSAAANSQLMSPPCAMVITIALSADDE